MEAVSIFVTYHFHAISIMICALSSDVLYTFIQTEHLAIMENSNLIHRCNGASGIHLIVLPPSTLLALILEKLLAGFIVIIQH